MHANGDPVLKNGNKQKRETSITHYSLDMNTRIRNFSPVFFFNAQEMMSIGK